MISTEQAFNDLNIDAVTGVQMLEWLGVVPSELSDPQRFSRLQSIISYFKQFPPDTQRFLIMRATKNKMVDKLQHVWEYSQLLQQKKVYEDINISIDRERSALGENSDPALKSSIESRSLENREQLARINDEINLYER